MLIGCIVGLMMQRVWRNVAILILFLFLTFNYQIYGSKMSSRDLNIVEILQIIFTYSQSTLMMYYSHKQKLTCILEASFIYFILQSTQSPWTARMLSVLSILQAASCALDSDASIISLKVELIKMIEIINCHSKYQYIS